MKSCLLICVLLSVSLLHAQERMVPRDLPGTKRDGTVLLPNQWSLNPAGSQIQLGVFPVNISVHPTGRWLAILHAGADTHEIVIVGTTTQSVISRVTIPQAFYGLTFSPDGRQVFASGGEFATVHRYAFSNGLLSDHRVLQAGDIRSKFVVAGLACDKEGKELFVAGPWEDSLVRMIIDDPASKKTIPMKKDSYPYAILPIEGKLFVSLWGAPSVAVIDTATNAIIANWPTADHPTEMALSPDGKALFVSCANSTKVSVINTETGKSLETLTCSLYPQAPSGNTPNSLCLSKDGELLFVANADANNVSVFNVSKPGESKPLGFIPVGWYPTSVRYVDATKKLYVANGKGSISRPNPQGPQPIDRAGVTIEQYIARLMQGTLSIINLPNPEQMQKLSKQAVACSPLKEDTSPTGQRDADNPIPAKVGDPSPIKYCVYIVKENRTYDQVFGDIARGNGDPSLCIFPEKVTPNHHKIANEFVLLDNFYVEGEVSADGHEWTMGAYATDFVEKVWPLRYRRGGPRTPKMTYPSEGAFPNIAPGAGGYFWDKCKEAGVTFRSYGEFIENGRTPNDPGTAKVKTLEGNFDPMFRSYDLSYPDAKRADRFLEELARFEKEDELPRFIVVRLPNDHTSGTALGKPTPTAMVADNDLALGRVVEGLSNSKFWKQMAIFVIEDDAQNGPDHVDAHRSVALVASPYCKRKVVDSNMYSTSSMLRTMGLILGTKPMSQFDAAARPMYGSFTAKPDFTPYKHEPARVSMTELNVAGSFGSDQTASFRLEKEDQADDLAFNEVIWRSVKGKDSPMPAPVRAAFFTPKD